MGMDIRLHIEIKIDDKWEHYGSPEIARGCKTYDLLFDIAECRSLGFPLDASIVTELDYKDYDCPKYYIGCIGPNLIHRIEKTLHDQWGIYLETDVLHTYFLDDGFCDGEYKNDFRIIFWFWG
jgi:hypothetical protein